jgi:acetoin utilization protein AcuB
MLGLPPKTPSNHEPTHELRAARTLIASCEAMIAAEIMTKNPLTLQTTDSVARAIDLLQSLPIRHLPVVDERGVLIGMVSDRDLGPSMRAAFIEGAVLEEMEMPLAQQLIADIMSIDPVAVSEDADVSEIVATILDERVGAVPVVDASDRVTGIVSYVDVLAATYRSEAESETETAIDTAGRPRPRPRARRNV